jgi:hypothetical protein
MNLKLTASIVAILVSLCSLSLAVDVFPRLPNINGAYNKLVDALEKLARSPQKNVSGAINDLNGAKTLLDMVGGHKGSYLPAAKKLVDEARQELTAIPLDAAHIEKGTELTRKALEQVNKAGKTASH